MDLIFVDRQSIAKTTKIGSFENFRLHGMVNGFGVWGGGAEIWLWAPAVIYILILLVGMYFGAEC